VLVVFNKAKKSNFVAGHTQGLFLDSHMVLPPARGAVGTYGFWVQSVDDGSSNYIQQWWLTLF
jgi:hypothetical protein